MRRLLKVCLLSSLFLIPLAKVTVYAQEIDFNQTYSDYLFTYNQYRNAHTEYIIAKGAYLTYQTLAAKTEALEKTRTMLKLRADVSRTYLTAIRQKISETSGISQADVNLYQSQIDAEVAFLEEHKTLLDAPATIEDLISTSQEFENRYSEAEILFYQALSLIVSGKENSLRSKVNQQITALENFTSQIRREGGKDTEIVERWVLEAKNRIDLSSSKQAEAQEIVDKIKERERDKNRRYTQATFLLEEANQYLKEATTFLKEIILEIKRA